MILRQSSIKQYLFCPRSFYYKLVQKIQPAYRNASAVHGTVIHKLIYNLHMKDWDLDPAEQYPKLLQAEEAKESVPIFWKTGQLEGYIKEAGEIINGYRTKEYNQNANVILSEDTFLQKIGWAGWFSGTIDQVRKHPDGVFELVDFKTSQFNPCQAFLDTDYQFGIYGYSLWKGRLKIPPEKLKINWYHLRDHIPYKRNCKGGQAGEERGDPRRSTSRSRQQMNEMKRDLSKIASQIRQKKFPRNPSYSSCPLCPYSKDCTADSMGSALNKKQEQQLAEVIYDAA